MPGRALAGCGPSYDFEDRINGLFIGLADRGRKDSPIAYVDCIRHQPGMVEIFDQLTSVRPGRLLGNGARAGLIAKNSWACAPRKRRPNHAQ